MPYQIAFEYQEGRYKSISDQKKFYKNLKGKIKDAQNSFNQKLKSEGLFDEDHYYLKPNKMAEEIKKEINETCDKFKKKIDDEKNKNHDFLSDDIIRDKLDKLYKGDKLGDKLSQEEFKEIIEEGKIRYSMKIPPGYGDNKKTVPEKFGDLIIWYQMMKYAKENNKPIIFVTEDKNKEDWLINVDEELVPRFSLIQEFYDKTGQLFYIYDFSQFMNKSEEYLGLKYNHKTKSDVEKLELYNFKNQIELIGSICPIGDFKSSFTLIFRVNAEIKDIKNLLNQLPHGNVLLEKSDFSYKIQRNNNEDLIELNISFSEYNWPKNQDHQSQIIKEYADNFINYYKSNIRF